MATAGETASMPYKKEFLTTSGPIPRGFGDAVAAFSQENDLTIQFFLGGNAEAYCRSGWSAAEKTERWSTGRRSELRLPVPVGNSAYALQIKLRPFVVAQILTVQRLNVWANGEKLAEFEIREKTTRTVLIPRRIAGLSSTIDVVFETPDAARPVDLGVNNDDRVLSVAFSSLVFYPDIYAPPTPMIDNQSFDHEIVGKVDALNNTQLMMGFESLGQNCEFGLVQRRCGAEPLGLLRFSSTPLPQLLTALEASFAGMGVVETTEIVESPNGREYMVHDSAFGFRYHAWVDVGQTSPDEVLGREIRRIPFLVRKLIEDLEASEKIFVFHGMHRLPQEEVFPLATLLRRYGFNTLLFVTLADPDHPAGTVVRIAYGFLVGYIERFAPGADAHDFLLDQWVGICREASRLQLVLRQTCQK